MPPANNQKRDELEDDDEPIEEEEETEEDEVPVVEPQLVPRTTIPEPRVNPRPSKKSKANGTSGPRETRWKNKDAEALHGEILSSLTAQEHSPHEVSIVVRTNGPEGWQRAGAIECSATSGDASISPGDALVRKLEDQIHLVGNNPGPVQYQLTWMWKVNSQQIAQTTINLPPRDRILAVREQQMKDQNGGYGYGPQQPPPGMGRPWQPPQQQGPQGPQQWQGPYYPPPYGYPPPPYYPQPQQQHAPPQQGVDPATQQLVATLVEQLNITRGELASMRNQPPPAPIHAPPMQASAPPTLAAPPPSFEDMMERGITRAVMALSGGRIGAGAQPPPPQNTLENQLQKASNEMVTGIITKTLSVVAKGFERSIGAGLGAPLSEMPAPDPETEIVEPPKPEDSLPFTQIPLEAKFADGRPVIFAASKETGGIDYMGALFSNPIFMEKLADGVNELTKAVADGVKKIGQTGTHVVHRTPGGAQDAGPKKTGFGNGWDDE